jgi:hypothetical protein
MGGKSRKTGGISKELITRIKSGGSAPELRKTAKPEKEKTQPKGLLFGEDD